VGFLLIYPDKVEFFGGHVRVSLRRSDTKQVRFRPNPHSWVGLGRWVSLEAEQNGQSVRLLVEPRERATLLGNRALGARLRTKLASWVISGDWA
jgi:hypothetical protein